MAVNMDSSTVRTVLQIIPRLEAGGAERTTLEINRALIEAGWRSIVLTSGGAMADQVRRDGGTLILGPVESKNPFVIARNGGLISRLVRQHRVDVMHVRSRAPAWSALRARQQTKIALISTWHGDYRASGPVKRWYNGGLARADRVIANSNYTAGRIREGYCDAHPGLDGRIRVIARGADLEEFSRSSVTDGQIAQMHQFWDIKPGEGQASAAITGPKSGTKHETNPATRPLIVLLPARMSAWKGHEVAIEAINNMIRSGHGPEFRLIFLGGRRLDGEIDGVKGNGSLNETNDPGIGYAEPGSTLERTLRDMVTKYGMDERVKFAGHCSDMAAAYAAADLVIVPSTRAEAFGRVAVEAGAMGVPVIASDHGGTRETIIDGTTGMLVPPGDAGALGSALTKMASLPAADLEKMGNAARAHVSKHYTTAAMAAATLDVYREVRGGQEGLTA